MSQFEVFATQKFLKLVMKIVKTFGGFFVDGDVKLWPLPSVQ